MATTQQPISVKSGTQTYLIECNRANSRIDEKAPTRQNGRWTTQCDFQLKRGDHITFFGGWSHASAESYLSVLNIYKA